MRKNSKILYSFKYRGISSYYIDENKYNYIRKKILDNGNETIREIEKSLEKLNFKLK